MHLSDINPNLPCLRPSTHCRKEKQRLSCSTNSKSGHSSSLSYSTQSKGFTSIPLLIQLCICPDEDYAYQTMKTLFASHHHYSPNACDEFGCNVLMYTLRYQRYKLFYFFLNETSIDLNLRSKDRQGNSILHYAVIYGKDDTNIMEALIENFIKFGIDIDERNIFGFTPLLFAMFCGRYDIALILLTKTDASPFVRDYIKLINILDYVEIDGKHRDILKKIQNNRQYSFCSSENRESTRLRIQIYKTLPRRSENSYQTIQNHPYKNFFESIFPQAAQDFSGMIRSSILKMLDRKNVSADLTNLIQYINQRYPRLINYRKADNSSSSTVSTITKPKTTTTPTKTTIAATLTTKILSRSESSKTNVHNIFNLFDPDLRPKAKITKVLATEQPQPIVSNIKAPTAFKRLGTKVAVVTAVSRPEVANRTTGTK